VTTRSFSAVGSTRWQTGITFAADLLVAVVFGGKHLQRWLNDSSTKPDFFSECMVRKS
jgi:hypothetical protein